ncbi:SDR family oxidoreductase [Portibacter lacus]|uniref:Short-chain dehydrogenase n=1 Tax=Portibacter lacus TaxID=1099794 RepID=A0AA37WEE5_9BACT|nr:SDR family oxidoreductase [Portibacter lacus]GLR18731.1 short-chain dehydrogenase [Portibacter lacus]
MEKKVIVITGASSGIGRSCAIYFIEKGHYVVGLDVNEAALDAVNVEDQFTFMKCDVSKEAEVKKCIGTTIEKYGDLDILVNSAGIQRYSTVTETTEEEWDLVMNVNLKSAFLCAKHAIPSMQKKGQGVVVNVSSVQAYITQHRVAPYSTSKTAMLGLTRSIAVDYAPEIRCVAICPGSVDTAMLQVAFDQAEDRDKTYNEVVDMHLMKRICPPSEVAALIGFLSGDDAGSITGQSFRIDGGIGISIPGN